MPIAESQIDMSLNDDIRGNAVLQQRLSLPMLTYLQS